MSEANANYHVSTKWEDTGGKDDIECDANILNGSPNTNGDSLQELIDKELALRSAAVTNGVDLPKSLFICDINNDNAETDATSKKAESFDIFDAVTPVNGCKRSGSFKLTRGVPVTEVDDFDELYEEVNSDEVVSNGHVTLTGLLSPELELSNASSLSDEKSEEKGDIDDSLLPCDSNVIPKDNSEFKTASFEADSIGGQTISFSDETESSLDSIRVMCDTSKTVDVVNPHFDELTSNASINDFVPVSEVDIVVDVQENSKLSNSGNINERSLVSTTSMLDVQKIVEDMENSRHIVDDNDLIIITQESSNQTRNNDNDVVVDVAATDIVHNDAQQCHYEKNASDGCSVEEDSCRVSEVSLNECNSTSVTEISAQCNGDETDDAGIFGLDNDNCDKYLNLSNVPGILVLDNDNCDEYLDLSNVPTSDQFEKGFERWSTEESNEAAIEMYEKSIISEVECQRIEERDFDLTISNVNDVVSESNEKKNVKKKKSISEESVTTTKTKKTKKTKKSEEKENISVNNVSQQNGLDDPNFHQILDDGDELSNVCVRDLKIMYCTEASKTTSSNKLSSHEEPVPASVPIKELTRSFGDLHVVNGSENSFHINNNSRSGFGKFDQLTKKAVMHVRSSDAAKAQQQFSQNDASQDSGNLCKACNKNVFAMEQIKAERHVWHKNCFRCKTCNKQLAVDIYSSHEGELFCKPHFRDLFKPKTVIEEEQPMKLKKPELIIRENEPMELPPDVVRASDKPDLGLEGLVSLNVKSRFQVFENPPVEEAANKSPVSVKRSPSILSKLAKFQAKGMDVGVSSDIFNGIDYEESSSSEEEPAPNDNITRSTVTKEKPVVFNKMNDVKKNWENGQTARKEERLEQRREELQNIRSRIFMGKQNKMKEAYENAVAESERSTGNTKKDVEIRSEKARSIKEKFEKGEVLPSDDSDTELDKKTSAKQEDMDVFEAGISKQSRSIFQQMDAAIKTQSQNSSSSPTPMQNGHRSRREVMTRQTSNDVVRASDPVEEVTVQTSDISSKFKFFETYKAPETKRKVFRITPPREGQQPKSESPERDLPKNPDVIRCDEQIDDENEVLKKSNTTAKMLSLFRQLEEAQENNISDGPKPMKKFTPPPQSHHDSESESEEDSEQSETSNPNDDIVRASDKTEDEYLKMAQNAAKAKALKEKFEKWEPERQLSSNAINLLDSEQANIDSTKSLRARFESMKAEQPTDKPRLKVNRFVEKSLPGFCDRCFKTVYPLEKVEAGDKVFHRNCFKCSRCHGILRMETFTMNNGHLYCVAHFKQLFITKGNYDEGFGNHQHKAKWPVHTGLPVANGIH